MSKIKYDISVMKYMQLFESITRAKKEINILIVHSSKRQKW